MVAPSSKFHKCMCIAHYFCVSTVSKVITSSIKQRDDCRVSIECVPMDQRSAVPFYQLDHRKRVHVERYGSVTHLSLKMYLQIYYVPSDLLRGVEVNAWGFGIYSGSCPGNHQLVLRSRSMVERNHYIQQNATWKETRNNKNDHETKDVHILSSSPASLDHSDSVGNIQGIIILAQSNIALLQSPRSNQSVDLFAFNIVQIPDSGLDLSLGGLNVHNKYESVGIFDKLH